jgi:glutamine---fructose-6-phosphate transaminase (isomerizing)
MSIRSEIFEQPDRLMGLLANQRRTVENIASQIRLREIQWVFLAARGTSDNAGRYANYLWGARNGLPLALATPSLFTYYQQPPRLHNALVVGISQSGQSPDIVSVLAEGRRQGNLTLAITNAPDSPLAQAADFVLDIQAGPELAVAATKTYTAELLAIAMLSAALAQDGSAWGELDRLGGWLQAALAQDEMIEKSAERYRYMQQCVVLGRGFNYATAYEWALKLKEMTYIAAEPYSTADFQHGPVAVVTQGFPVLAVASNGVVLESLLDFMRHLKAELQAELVVISNSQAALGLAQVPIAIPPDVPEWLSPLVNIIPAQLFAYHLTLARGLDAEQPRILRKVTETT